MIIYPLPPQELDDKTLDKNIKTIAQTLCNSHHYLLFNQYQKDFPHHAEFIDKTIYNNKSYEERDNIPLKLKESDNTYSKWACECRANYLKLVEIGLQCCEEYSFRKNWFYRKSTPYQRKKWSIHPSIYIIEWAKDNIPDLPNVTESNQCDALYTGYGMIIPDRSDKITQFPVCVPDSYNLLKKNKKDLYSHYIEILIDESYRNYYKEKLTKKPACFSVWTRREKPAYLK